MVSERVKTIGNAFIHRVPWARIIFLIGVAGGFILLVLRIASAHPGRAKVAFWVACYCAASASALSLWTIVLHLRHYSRPELQRYIVRILLMVPIYSLDALLSLRFVGEAPYIDAIREVYEGFVIYNFFALLMTYLGGVQECEKVVCAQPLTPHPPPWKWCVKPFKPDENFFLMCRFGVVQFMIVKPTCALIGLILEVTGHYGKLDFADPYPYFLIVLNISVSTAFTSLVYFYSVTHEALADLKPLGKFIAIKCVIFLAFWQSVIIALCQHFKLIHDTETWSSHDINVGLQHFLICVEMLAIAYMHTHVFSHVPYRVDPASAPLLPNPKMILNPLNVRDVGQDVKSTFKAGRDRLRGNSPSPSPSLGPSSDPPTPEAMQTTGQQGGNNNNNRWFKKHLDVMATELTATPTSSSDSNV